MVPSPWSKNIMSYHIISYHIIKYHIKYHIILARVTPEPLQNALLKNITLMVPSPWSNNIMSYQCISYQCISMHIISMHINAYHINAYQCISYYIISYHIKYHIILARLTPTHCKTNLKKKTWPLRYRSFGHHCWTRYMVYIVHYGPVLPNEIPENCNIIEIWFYLRPGPKQNTHEGQSTSAFLLFSPSGLCWCPPWEAFSPFSPSASSCPSSLFSGGLHISAQGSIDLLTWKTYTVTDEIFSHCRSAQTTPHWL